jgi:hypothetical protein
MSSLPSALLQIYSVFICDNNSAWTPLKNIIEHAVASSSSPRQTFATEFRRMRKLERARLNAWLNSTATEQRAIDAGASGALHMLRAAVSSVVAGVNIRDAFDLRRPGARRQLGFSHHEKVAACVEFQRRTGVRLAHINLPKRYDLRSINRIRATMFKTHADQELKKLAWSFCVTG